MHFSPKEYSTAMTALITVLVVFVVAPIAALIGLLSFSAESGWTSSTAFAFWVIVLMMAFGFVSNVRRRIAILSHVRRRRIRAIGLYDRVAELIEVYEGSGDPAVRFKDATYTFSGVPGSTDFQMLIAGDAGVDHYDVTRQGFQLREGDTPDYELEQVDVLIAELDDRIRVFQDEQHESPLKVVTKQSTLV